VGLNLHVENAAESTGKESVGCYVQ